MVTQIDYPKRKIIVDGVAFRPPRRMFEFLAFLAKRPGVVRSRQEIMDHLQIHHDASDRTIDSLVKRARKKGYDYICASYGIGYYWSDES